MAKQLTLFLSYVSEDQKLADTIAASLTSAFRRSVSLKYMSQFPLGVDYHRLIGEALDNTDILLVIATGHEKLSHGYTGYEVGYFDKSRHTRPYVDDDNTVKRLVIPITLLADIPGTLATMQGISIAEGDRYVLEADPADPAGKAKREPAGDDPFFRLLARIDSVLDAVNPATRAPEMRALDVEEYRAEAVKFRQQLLLAMSSLPVRRDFPKTRVTLRLPADFDAQQDPLEKGALIACNGPTNGIFLQESVLPWTAWSDFVRCIGSDDIAMSWNDALRSLLASAVNADFANSDQLVFSHDEKRLFRLFVSKSTSFFDGTRELDIYVVEVLRYRDVGDPFTTLLGKALAIGLRYRSLFLETSSPFGPVAFRLCKRDEWNTMIGQLQREMRLLLLQSREAALGDRRNLIAIYGSDAAAVDRIVANMSLWNDQKGKLDAAAAASLQQGGKSDQALDAFLSTLSEFCAQTETVSTTYLSAVLEQLKNVLQDDVAAHRRR